MSGFHEINIFYSIIVHIGLIYNVIVFLPLGNKPK